jgi:hypothetical protein
MTHTAALSDGPTTTLTTDGELTGMLTRLERRLFPDPPAMALLSGPIAAAASSPGGSPREPEPATPPDAEESFAAMLRRMAGIQSREFAMQLANQISRVRSGPE